MAKKSMILVGMLAVVFVAAIPALAQQPDSQTAAETVPAAGTETTTGGEDTTAPTPDSTATLSFELTVKGDPPAGTTFLGDIVQGFPPVQLTDPDGNGVFTGSLNVPIAQPRPAEFPVQIEQNNGGNITVLKDFGLVPIDGDKTFSAEVDFGQNGGSGTTTTEGTTGEQTAGETTAAAGGTTGERTGREGTTGPNGEITGPNGEVTEPNGEVTSPNGETTGPNGETTGPNGETTGPNGEVTGGAPGGGGGGGSADGGGNAQGGSPQQGSASSEGGGVSGAVGDAFSPVTRGTLPHTGGGWAVLLLVAAALIGGGWLLVRRFSPSSG